MASRVIPFPTELRPRLPTIVGNVDYLTLRHRLEQIDQLLLASGVEADFVERALIEGLLLAGLNRSRQLDLKKAVDLEDYFLDTTCLKANVHFPVDWVLLRDGTRTL